MEQITRTQNLAKDYYQIKKTLNLLQDKVEQNLLQNGLEQIAKMKNLSQNELEQIPKMQTLSRNELEQIAKMRRIKNYKNMSKEGFFIALLKSSRSFYKNYEGYSDNARIEKI